jgi:phospholipase C
VAISDTGGLAMGYYDGAQLTMWKRAQEHALADNFFMAAFGESYLNHMWLVCACTLVHQDAPASMRAQLDEQGRLSASRIPQPRRSQGHQPSSLAL